MYTDKLIETLIKCPKHIVEPPKSVNTERTSSFKRTFTMTSDDGQNNFNGFILCNKFFQENFSIGLSHNPKEEKGTIVLIRINGLHGGTKVHPHHSYYHIHLATAERINNGLKSEGKIIETSDYSSYETAIQYFIKYIGLSISDRHKYFPPPSSQIDLILN